MSLRSDNFSSLVSILQKHSYIQSEKTAFIFLSDTLQEKEKLTYLQLDTKARLIAKHLQHQAKPGDRILLCYPHGLEFICAFMGCLYAGMIAVPAFPLRNNRHAERLRLMIDDCQAQVILSTSAVIDFMSQNIRFQDLHYLATEELENNFKTFHQSSIEPETLAFLQYTSGSTGNPKGVMVSHNNIIHNAQSLETAFGFNKTKNKVTAFWIPVQHDMSLIGEILLNIFVGGTGIMMSPTAFIERPINWLKAIDRYRAHYAAAPNFAFDLCVEKISAEDKAQLNLSCWKVAMNASEPIRWKTLKRFSAAFKPCGFEPEYAMPAYGLAEVTLLLSGTSLSSKPVMCTVDKTAYEQGEFKVVAKPQSSAAEKTITLASSGKILWAEPKHKVRIVDPESLTVCPAHKMGEIWVQSESVACGYWQKNEASEETFKAYLKDGRGPFLRTGDLGIMHKGELYITGRIKDIIIIQGRNIYPQDIEAAVEASHPAVRLDCAAAFSIDKDGEEKLVVVAEIERIARKQNPYDIMHAIRKAVIDVAEISPYDIQLLQPAQAFKTTSGKIQRRATKHAYLTGELKTIDLKKEPEYDDYLSHLKEKLLQIYQDVLCVRNISPTDKFSQLGGDSFKAVLLHDALCHHFSYKLDLSPSIAFDYPSLNELETHLRNMFEEKGLHTYADMEHLEDKHEAIAIIGLSCRFPGDAIDPPSFWNILIEGKETISEIPKDRWSLSEYYDPSGESTDKMTVKYGAFIQKIKEFDAEFFNIPPVEAESMDPQQRILLETTWHALENAGINAEKLKDSNTSVFVGATAHEYGDLLLKQGQHSSYFTTGNTLSVLAGRISYALGLQGPSMTIDTACSSSLVALHEACDSLNLNESNLAIVGGVNALLSPDAYINLSKANMLAADGHCKVFSEEANGYVRGEGCAVLILKRLSQAQSDDDNILAVIKSAVVNQDGASSGLTVPSGVAQEHLLHKALMHAQLESHDIDYIETHGTGTKLGDPMEMHALGAVYQQSHNENNPLYVGSVKANIGHLEAAAGIASVVKVILSLQHELIPPQIGVGAINSKINLNTVPTKIPMQPTEWKRAANKTRRAGISSFGFSGTNAHVILEEAPHFEFEGSDIQPQMHLLIISAKTKETLEKQIKNYLDYLKNSQENIENICYTSQKGRALFSYYIGILGSNTQELIFNIENQKYISSEDIKLYHYADSIKMPKAHLPLYPFSEQIFWPKNLSVSPKKNYTIPGLHPLLGTAIRLGAENGIAFITEVSNNYPDFVIDHCVFDIPVVTGPAFISAIISALFYENQTLSGQLNLINFNQPLALSEGKQRELQIFIARNIENERCIYVESRDAANKEINDWVCHATAQLSEGAAENKTEERLNWSDKISELREAYQPSTKEELYDVFMQKKGNAIRRHSCWIEELWCSETAALAQLRLPGIGEESKSGFLLHQGCIEACVYLGVWLQAHRDQNAALTTYLPYAITKLNYDLSSRADPMWVYIEYSDMATISSDLFQLDAYLLDAEGQALVELQGFWLKAASKDALLTGINNIVNRPEDQSRLQQKVQIQEPNKIFDEQQVYRIILSCASQTLGLELEDINKHSDKGFMEMGMDSLIAVELAKQLKAYFGEKIIPNATVLYSYSTIDALSNYINACFAGTLSQNKIAKVKPISNESIAVIGMSGRFPGASTTEEFWQLLAQGSSGISEVPQHRWNIDNYYDANAATPGKMCSRNGGFMPINIDQFDADFFGISPREAAYIDPQQRLLLETSWEALEDAGIDPSTLKGSRTGVYIGIWASDFNQLLAKKGQLTDINQYSGLGGALAEAAGRISYEFGFQGPSVAIDTVCSSSLVALHQGCESLQRGNCDTVLVGGVNLLLDPATSIGFSQMHMLSPEGYCKTFDAQANGYVRGEGCGILVLKRLSDAQKAGDSILAVIKATAVNQDGASSGFTAPNGLAQEQLLSEVLAKAKLSAKDISYIETHGTGTELGDPIEVNSIKAVYGADRDKGNPLVLGALKSNIGHLESAAGIAGAIKVILSMQHGSIPANLHFTKLNPKIDIDSIPAILPTELYTWDSLGDTRYAAVSAFGATGTNAHAIFAEAPAYDFKETAVTQKNHLLMISAKSKESLQQQIQNFISYLKTTEDNIQNICFTSQRARCLFEYKVAVIGEDIKELIRKLENKHYATEEDIDNTKYAVNTRLKKVKLPLYVFQRESFWPEILQEEAEIVSSKDAEHCKLMFTEQGTLESIKFVPYGLHELRADEILVAVKSTGVNLRDVLAIMGMYHGFDGEIGLECSGRVIAVGREVTRFSAGDDVLGIAIGSYADVVITKEDLMVVKPSVLSYEEAATLPIAYLTACVGLMSLAKIKAGEKVLIHAAAGGVGLAAVHVVKWLGAEIYATAGSEEKRNYLRSLGINHVYHSRDTEFAQKILADTNNYGVDIVLNSLTGEGFIAASMACCAKNARFVEIGRINIWEPEKVAKYRSDINYEIMQIDDVIKNNSDYIKTYLQQIITEVNYGNLPSLPYNIFDINEVHHALAYLQQAKNIGKVIVKISDIKLSPVTSTKVDKNNIESIHEFVCDTVRKVLGINRNQLDESRGFFDLGMDSLTAAELNKILRTELGDCGLTSTSVFDYPNVNALIEHISTHLQGGSQALPTQSIASDKEDAVAIIGMSCRMPHAQNVEEFWQQLLTDEDTIESFKEARKGLIAFDEDDPDYQGSFLSKIAEFDNNFFGISPREAEIMDPQQRILLEVSWEALEYANIIPDNLEKTKVGVFIGAAGTDYGHLLERVQEFSSEKSAHLVTGTLLSALSGRISYLLGFQGPSVTVDTACSSSLSAIHQACESLKSGDSDLALAGGANIILDAKVFERFQQAGIISQSGLCHTFDAKADGYVRGEGCGIVVLKRLSAARRDNDTILAIIKGTGINQDGASSGFTVPNGSAQTQLMQTTLEKAKVKPETVSYIETHGTGTSLGDPIEVNAIGDVYAQSHTEDEPIILGALKSRIGHLETASGIASVIKVIQAFQHQAIPKNLHFSELNKHIDLEHNKVKLALENAPWLPSSLPRRAAISSFGFTGTNAHIILEEASTSAFDKNLAKQKKHILLISAKTPTALELLIQKYITYLQSTSINIQNICFTSQTSRTMFEYQIAVMGESIMELISNLQQKKYCTEEELEQYCYPDDTQLNKTLLPSYAFDRQHYWAEALTHSMHSFRRGKTLHPLLGEKTLLGAVDATVFNSTVSKQYPDFVADHCVYNKAVISGPALLSAMVSAVQLETISGNISIASIEFNLPLVLSDSTERDLQIYIRRDSKNSGTINVHSKWHDKNETSWTLHASAHLIDSDRNELDRDRISFQEKIAELPQQYQLYLSKTQVYDEFLRSRGTHIQGHSAWIEELWSNDRECLSRLRLPGKNEDKRAGFIIHPGCLESCFYMAAVLRSIQQANVEMYLPYAIEKVLYSTQKNEEPMWAYVTLPENNNTEVFSIDAYFLSASGQVILCLQGIWLKLASENSFLSALENTNEKSGSKTEAPVESIPSSETIFDEKQILEILKSQASVFLGISQDEMASNLDKGFMEMGMDSLTAVEMAKELKKYFGEAIITNATVLYNFPNIRLLSEYISNCCTNTPLSVVSTRVENSVNEPIAIIGMSGRFPGAKDIHAFWELLAEGKSGIVEVPANRWDVDAYYDPNINAPGKICSRNGGFLDTPIENFDAAFFGMSPREAAYVDPQQRILLEATWTALEDAGINPNDLRGSRTGVYIGIWTSDYHQLLAKHQQPEDINSFGGLGSGLAEPAGRISYMFGLQGPSVAVDTVCSSSLVALHQACQGLQMGDCDAAIIGGVNLMLDPATSIGFNQLHMLSPDGYCKTFDESANGYVRGEGCGVLILKRLRDAKLAGDRILAVVRASGVNQDGASSGFTAPNGVAQERLLREVLYKAKLSPVDISYIETHGTGTELGDPIEVGSIKTVYGEKRETNCPIVLGALKSNIGHLESAAGVASLTKVVLALQNETIPANLHFSQLNSKIDIDSIPAVIPTSSVPWHKDPNKKRYAAVSAFGATGTNAHTILEESPSNDFIESEITQSQHLLIISAKTESSLQRQIQNYLSYLKSTKDPIKNICYTSQIGRCQFEHIIAVMGETTEELIRKLEAQQYLIDEDIESYKYPIGTKLLKVALPSYSFEPKPYWAKVLNTNQIIITAESKEPAPQSAITTADININEYIYNQVAEVLGIPKDEHVDETKNFTELGFDSLMVVELANRLKTIIEINANMLYEYSNIEKLRNFINAQLNPVEGSREYNPLLCLRAEGKQLPLFCVHGIDGHAEIFMDLANDLHIDRPIYAFQGQEQNYGVHFITIQERAAFYVKALQNIQANGPYYIFGWSMGGSIALEMVHQLHLAGEEIAFLGMADGLIRTSTREPKNMNFKEAAKFYLYIYGQNITAENYHLMDSLEERDIAHLVNELLMKNASNDDQIIKEIHQLQDNFNELLSYAANNLNDALILFNPKDQKLAEDDELLEFKHLLRGSASNEWRKISRHIKRYYVEGDHFSMLSMPHNKNLEEILEQYLSDN